MCDRQPSLTSAANIVLLVQRGLEGDVQIQIQHWALNCSYCKNNSCNVSELLKCHLFVVEW